MKIVNASKNGVFTLILGHDHHLFFSRYRLVAYLGPLGPRLFNFNGAPRMARPVRNHLNAMLPMRYREFKAVADICSDTVIPEFMQGIYFEIAKASVLGRVLAR